VGYALSLSRCVPSRESPLFKYLAPKNKLPCRKRDKAVGGIVGFVSQTEPIRATADCCNAGNLPCKRYLHSPRCLPSGLTVAERLDKTGRLESAGTRPTIIALQIQENSIRLYTWLTTALLTTSLAHAAPATCDLATIEKDIDTIIDSVIKYDNERGEALMVRVGKLVETGKISKEQAGMFMLGMMRNEAFVKQQDDRIKLADKGMKKLAAMKESRQPDCAAAEKIKTDIASMKESSRQQWALIDQKIETDLLSAGFAK